MSAEKNFSALLEGIFEALGANEDLPLFDDDALAALRSRIAEDLQGPHLDDTIDAVKRAVASLQHTGFTHAAVQLAVVAQHAAWDAGARPDAAHRPEGVLGELKAPALDGDRPEGAISLASILSGAPDARARHLGAAETPVRWPADQVPRTRRAGSSHLRPQTLKPEPRKARIPRLSVPRAPKR
ncbi:MAG TPA: hypothetical protein RMG48_12100 [Myxococcales bacterium LLY-WYZ-16_1]|nr:hypothetical protein [Myxococcales bacterium LLY-WYZ-16_1]